MNEESKFPQEFVTPEIEMKEEEDFPGKQVPSNQLVKPVPRYLLKGYCFMSHDSHCPSSIPSQILAINNWTSLKFN